MSQRDPLDSFEDALFRAARRERTQSRAAERTAAAVVTAHQQRRLRRAVAPVAGALAIAAGVALVLAGSHTEPSALPIQAEYVGAKHAPNSSAERPAASVSPLATGSGEAAAKVAFTTRAEELVMLERARGELAAGNADSALLLLDQYERVSGGHLAAEASLLRIEALSLAGRKELAAKLAQRFVDSDPNSPLAERARGFIAKQAEGTPGAKPSSRGER